jgi:hypothetical protein
MYRIIHQKLRLFQIPSNNGNTHHKHVNRNPGSKHFSITLILHGEVKLMDLALIAVVISLIVFVFQIVTLVLIAGMKKSLGSIKAAPAPAAERDRFEKRDNEFRRHDRRPQQDNRPRQQQQPQPQQQQPAATAAGESVDKSLRDINLRLKNAERDQENARRRMQQGGGVSQDQHRGRGDRFDRGDRGERFDRGDRGDRFDRGDRGDRGDREHRGRDHRGNRHDRHRDRGGRGNWQDRDRNRQGGQYGQQPGAPVPAAAPEGEPMFERKDIIAPEMQANPPVEAPVTATPDLAPADYSSDENLEHGRKIIVKRRMLQGESSEAGAAAGADDSQGTAEAAPAAAPVAVSSPGEETATGSEPGQEGEIMFGRRKAL